MWDMGYDHERSLYIILLFFASIAILLPAVLVDRILPPFFFDEQYLLQVIYGLFVFYFCALRIDVYFVVFLVGTVAVVAAAAAARIAIVLAVRAEIKNDLFLSQCILRLMRKENRTTSTKLGREGLQYFLLHHLLPPQ